MCVFFFFFFFFLIICANNNNNFDFKEFLSAFDFNFGSIESRDELVSAAKSAIDAIRTNDANGGNFILRGTREDEQRAVARLAAAGLIEKDKNKHVLF